MPGKSFHIPDLISLCTPYFELRTNKHCRQATVSATKWAENAGFLEQDELTSLSGLKPGLLAALCYPTCDLTQLRIVSQFWILLIHWSDKSSSSGEGAFEEIWRQLVRETTSTWQRRFQLHLSSYHAARAQMISDNEGGKVLDMESFKSVRRESSGIMMAFDLIEYAEGLRLPEEVYAAPTLQLLRQNAHDIVTWVNDIASYNMAQSVDDFHNLIAVIIAQNGLTAQSAMPYAEKLIKDLVQDFLSSEQELIQESGKAHDDVRAYVQSLRDWIVGFVHWVYETERYFQGNGEEVRSFGWIFLQPQRRSLDSTKTSTIAS